MKENQDTTVISNCPVWKWPTEKEKRASDYSNC